MRIPIALPIFVRQVGMPWPEESMTQNISRSGVLFETSRAYEPGEEVLGKIPWGEWADAGEISGRVVRFESLAGQPGDASLPNVDDRNPILARVAIHWTAQPESSAKNS